MVTQTKINFSQISDPVLPIKDDDLLVGIQMDSTGAYTDVKIRRRDILAGNRINWLGVYDPDTEYVAYDGVSYNGSSYIALVTSTGAQPDESPEQWGILASMGQQGIDGDLSPAAQQAISDALASAEASAAQAQGFATSASTSASTATTKATAASSSSIEAGTYASQAQGSANDALASKTAAAASAVVASSQASLLSAALAGFREVFIGAFAADPLTDGNGNALKEGAEYFNTTTDKLRFYSNGAWVDYDEDVQNITTNAALSATNAAASAAAAAGSATTASNAAAQVAGFDAAVTAAANSASDANTSALASAASATAAANSAASASTSSDSASASAASATNTVNTAVASITTSVKSDLATNSGASQIGYSNGQTVQSQLDLLNVTRQSQSFTATAGQTTFPIANGYTATLVQVFVNGVKLPSGDYTAGDGANVVLNTGVVAGTSVEILPFASIPVVNGVTASDLGSTNPTLGSAMVGHGTGTVKSALDAFGANDGLKMLGNVSSAAILRTIEPSTPYQRIQIRSGSLTEGTSVLMGGVFYYDPNQTAADNTGIVIRTTSGNKAWVREFNAGNHLHLNMFWEQADGSDYYPAFMRFDAGAALTSGTANRSLNLDLPQGTVSLSQPFVMTVNRSYHFWGAGGQDGGTNIVPAWSNITTNTTYQNYGLFHQANTTAGQVGFSMHNLLFSGAAAICHGVYRSDAGHFVEENCQILNFNGSGFQHMGCQDMWSNTDVQGCGRTSGTRTALADVSDPTKTTAAPIEIGLTSDNAPNYCRYSCKQVEANFVSPYVRINGSGGYGNVFRDMHTEQRTLLSGFDTPSNYSWATAISVVGGEWVFDHLGCVQLATSYNIGAYTVAAIINQQRGTNIISTATNTTGSLTIDNSAFGSLTVASRDGIFRVANTYFGGSIAITYPAFNLGFNFEGCYVVGDLSVTLDGSNSQIPKFIERNTINGNVTVGCSYTNLVDNYILGTLNYNSSRGFDVNNRVTGVRTYASYSDGKRDAGERRSLWTTSAGVGALGTVAVGDKIENSVPSAGAPAYWGVSVAGNPGTFIAGGHYLGTYETSGGEINAYIPGTYTASQVIYARSVQAQFSIQANFNGGNGFAKSMQLLTAPTASWVLTIYSGSTSIGTITFAAGSLVPTAVSITATSFVSGGLFKIVAPATADSTAAGLTLSIPLIRT